MWNPIGPLQSDACNWEGCGSAAVIAVGFGWRLGIPTRLGHPSLNYLFQGTQFSNNQPWSLPSPSPPPPLILPFQSNSSFLLFDFQKENLPSHLK